ncbi:unnamed protein product [Rhizoctonia solani]|uniref:Serine-threonine kinase receptor-associated protein n=1 Tax=Rhizoctonia solani TaxID=456999 RepID=A0A8H3CW45_9AGAM|nr:unnamed protein product [Rhizoctonia solani]
MAARNTPLTCSGHTRPVVHLAFSPMQESDGTYLLVSSCKDGNPMLRDWRGDWVGTFVGHKGAVWQTKLSADSARALSGSADFTAKLWDTYTGQALLSLPHEHIVRTVALGPGGTHGMTGGQEKKVRLWDLRGEKPEPSFLKAPGLATAHEGTVKSVIWGSEHMGVSAGDDAVVRWWDLRTLASPVHLKLPEAPTSMELSIPTQTLTITHGKTVSFVPLSGPESGPSHQVTLAHAPSSASLHPVFGDRFVAGSVGDPWVRVYGLEAGEEREVYKGHHGPVHCVEYSPDGEMYATGSEDGGNDPALADDTRQVVRPLAGDDERGELVTQLIPEEEIRCNLYLSMHPHQVLLSLLAALTLVAAAPTQAVLGLGDIERATPATVQTSNATLNTEREETNIRVLTFNCWGLRFVSQQRLARITAIADRILNASPAYDVVALQELWLKSDHALIAEAVASVLPYSTVFYSGAFGSGLSLFSRYPIEQAQMHPFALAGDPIDVLGGDWFVGKGVAAATLSHPVLGHIELLTSHMFARGGETGTVLQQAHRLIGAWEYAQLIRRAAELGRYVIVAGDFNAVDGSAPLEFIRAHAKVQDAWWATHNLSSPAVPIVFPIPKDGAATSALAAIHEHGVTADSPLNSWSAGKPLDAVARRHLGKRLDYVLYRGPDARAQYELVAGDAKVVMTERMPDLGVSLSDHFGVEVVLEIAPAGVSTQNEPEESNAIDVDSTEVLPPLPIPPPVARTRALILHDTLHVLHAAIPASYAASTAYLTTGIACAFSLVALAVAAGAAGWGPHAKQYRRRVERSTSPVRAERKRPRAYTTPAHSQPPTPTPSSEAQLSLSSSARVSSPPPPALRLPFLAAKSRPIQAPWWIGIVLVLVGALLAAAGTTLLYAGVLFGRWERNAIWDVIDQMERLSSRGGIGQ